MEELFAELMSALTEKLDTVSEALNFDAIVDKASDTVQSMVDAISEKGIELDDTTRESLIAKLTGAIGDDPQAIMDNLALIADNPLNFIENVPELASSDLDFSADNVANVSGNGKNISFGSIGCWDECFATTKDHGKRLTCGYQY